MQCSSGFSARGGGQLPPLASPLDRWTWSLTWIELFVDKLSESQYKQSENYPD